MSKITYQDSILFIEQQVGVSYHQARRTLKEVSYLIQSKVREGLDIQLDGLFNITYSVTGTVIYNNLTYTLSDLKDDVSKKLEDTYRIYDTQLIIQTWVNYLIDAIERGYSVGVKGVATILVLEDEVTNVVTLRGRVSPQLKKPELATFITLEDSEIYSQVFKREELRLSFSLADTLRVPRRVQTGQKQVAYVSELSGESE